MRDRIRDAFHKIQADQELKDRTAARLAEEIHRRSRKKRSLPVRRLAVLAAALAIFLTGAGVFRSYYTVSAAISVDADASLELGVNCFDRVISVEGCGEEGQALAEALDLKHRNYAAALEELLNSPEIREQLSESLPVEITVAGDDPKQTEEILQTAADQTSDSCPVRCQAGNSAEAEDAAEAGLSLGKYRAYLELLELDPAAEPEDLAEMTMREIRDRIRELEDAASGKEASEDPGSETEASVHTWEPAGNSGSGGSRTDSPGKGREKNRGAEKSQRRGKES